MPLTTALSKILDQTHSEFDNTIKPDMVVSEVIKLLSNDTLDSLSYLLEQPLAPLNDKASSEHMYVYKIINDALQPESTNHQKQLAQFCCVAILSKLLPKQFVEEQIINTLLKENSRQLNMSLLREYKLYPDKWIALAKILNLFSIEEVICEDNQLELFTLEELDNLRIVLKHCHIKRFHLYKLDQPGLSELLNLTEEQITGFNTALKHSRIETFSYKQNGFSYDYCERANCSNQLNRLAKCLADTPVINFALNWGDITMWDKTEWLTFKQLLKQFVSLDLKENSLRKLEVDQWRFLGEILKDSQLQKLSLANNNLCHQIDRMEWFKRWPGFLNCIEQLPVIELDISGNSFIQRLEDEYWFDLSNAINKTPIQRLDLHGDEMTYYYGDPNRVIPKAWETFCVSMKNTRLVELGLMDNELYKLSNAQWKNFADLIECGTIKKLNLAKNKLNNLYIECEKTTKEMHADPRLSSLSCMPEERRMLVIAKVAFSDLFQIISNCEFVNLNDNQFETWNQHTWDCFYAQIYSSTVSAIALSILDEKRARELKAVLQFNRRSSLVKDPSIGGLKYIVAN